MATDLDRELLETVTSKQNKIRDFLQEKDEGFQDFAENYTERLRKFFRQKPRVSEGDKFRNFADDSRARFRAFLGVNPAVQSLSPEDEVVVTPEGIGPLMYGRSRLGNIGDRISSGIGSLKEFLQYYFGNPTVNAELLDYVDSMRTITNNLEQATEALYPVFQKMNPRISYAKLREILLQRGFVPSLQTEEDFLPETIIRPQPEMVPEMPFAPSPPPIRDVFQDTERQKQDALLRELEELQRRGELGNTPAPFDFAQSNRDYLELERSLGDPTLTLEQRGEIGRKIAEINRLQALARSKLYDM